jgi:hypothetical protein
MTSSARICEATKVVDHWQIELIKYFMLLPADLSTSPSDGSQDKRAHTQCAKLCSHELAACSKRELIDVVFDQEMRERSSITLLEISFSAP